MSTESAYLLDSVPDVAGYCQEKSHELEIELERAGVALGIDWEDDVQVLCLARDALEHMHETVDAYGHHHDDFQLKAKMQLFAISCLMINLMAESAAHGIHTHGGPAWKAFSRGLSRVRSEITSPPPGVLNS